MLPLKRWLFGSENFSSDYGEMNFYETENALYALAKFRKADDVLKSKQMLLENDYQLGESSFKLLQEYPQKAYLEIFQRYYPRTFYRRICDNKFPSSGIAFINAVAAYKNDSSAKILKSILDRKPFTPCSVDTNYLRQQLGYAIWNNKCAAYLKMSKQVEGSCKEQKRATFERPVETVELPPAVSKEPVGWW